MIVTVYIDESGTHAGSPVMTLGGRVARLGQWVHFDRKWRGLRKRYDDLPYFHARKFKARSGPFQGWDDVKCNRFLDRAQRIISKHTLCGFAATLDHDEYKTFYRAVERPKKVKVDSKYGLCFRLVLVDFIRMLCRSLPDDKLTIHFVLESGDPGSGDAKEIFDLAKKSAPPDLADVLGTLTSGDKADFRACRRPT